MSEMWTDDYAWLGLVAGVMTTAAFLPQVIKVWASRSTSDISLTMFLVLTSGILLWLVYGIFIKDIPLVLANSITLVFTTAILIAKLKFK